MIKCVFFLLMYLFLVKLISCSLVFIFWIWFLLVEELLFWVGEGDLEWVVVVVFGVGDLGNNIGIFNIFWN